MQQLKRMKEWHDQLMDFMILNPKATLADMAVHFDSSPSALCVVIRSDLFQACLAERRRVRHQIVDETIAHKLEKVAKTGLDLMQKKMERVRDELPMEDLRESTETALNALGYGSQSTPSQQTTNTVIYVTKEDLLKARALMNKRKEVVDGEFEQIA